MNVQLINLDVNYLKMFNLNETICKTNVSVTDFANLLTQNYDNHMVGPDGRCFHAAWAVSKSAH